MALARRKSHKLLVKVRAAQAAVLLAKKEASAATEAVKSTWVNITGSFPEAAVDLSILEAESYAEQPGAAADIVSTEVPAVAVAAANVQAEQEATGDVTAVVPQAAET